MVESYRHADLKYDLYWDLVKDEKYADVERAVGSTRVDLLTEINNTPVAIEIQYTPISLKSILHRMTEHTKKGFHTLWLFPEEILVQGDVVRRHQWVLAIQHLQEGVIFVLKDQQIIPARIDYSLQFLKKTIKQDKKFLDMQSPIFLENLTFKQNDIYGINITTVDEWWIESYLDLF